MTTEHTGGGDPRRSVELLWGLREPGRRGPRARLTIADIVAAAIAVADAEGLAAVSMRRIGDDLGVAAMSLYTYLPGKGELIDLMVDTASGEAVSARSASARSASARSASSQPGAAADEGGWRACLAGLARENWRLYRRHPWLLQVAHHRPALGPGVIAKYDHELRALDGVGLSDVEMDSALTLVLGHVATAARGLLDAAGIRERSGLTDQQWWAEAGPALEGVLDTERYPLAARVGRAAGQAHGAANDPEHTFEFGLDRILDGVGALIRSRTGGG